MVVDPFIGIHTRVSHTSLPSGFRIVKRTPIGMHCDCSFLSISLFLFLSLCTGVPALIFLQLSTVYANRAGAVKYESTRVRYQNIACHLFVSLATHSIHIRFTTITFEYRQFYLYSISPFYLDLFHDLHAHFIPRLNILIKQ